MLGHVLNLSAVKHCNVDSETLKDLITYFFCAVKWRVDINFSGL